MTTALVNPEEVYKLSPEALKFTEVYLQTLNVTDTAYQLAISEEEAAGYLRKKEVRRFIDTVFLEQGYMNKFKLQGLLEKVIESKLEEAEESEVYTGKDLVDLITLMHKMRMDEATLQQRASDTSPASQTNIQNNFGDNLTSLISKLVTGDTK